MCLRPIRIKNPSAVISVNGGQKAFIEVPCGSCAECKNSQRLQWRFRSFHHVKECLNKGGFVYFDTLTYSESSVPRLSHYIDISSINESLLSRYERLCQDSISVERPILIDDVYVFDSSHWRNFLKNLRRQLDYHFPGVKFTYFLTSEYGTNEDYTHRPHYHVLFFVNDKRLISHYDFSLLVSKCWNYGRTDGLPYQPRNYVDEHSCLSPDDSCMKMCNYVSKYVTKDSTFQKVIDNRLSLLKKHLCDDKFKEIKRQVSMFHRQSQGFGRSFIDNLTDIDLNSILDNGSVSLVDDKKVVMTLPLPLYYKRHLFYVLHMDDEGKYYWQPNSLGLEYLRRSFERNIKNYEKLLFDSYINFDAECQKVILYLLNGRTLHDLATFAVMYKDRLRPLFSSPYHLSYSEFERNYIDTILSTSYVHEMPFSDVIHRDLDNNTIYVPVRAFSHFNSISKIIDYDVFLSSHVISQDTCSDFHNFDYLLSIFRSNKRCSNNDVQLTFEFIEELEQKFKHLYKYGY